VTATEHEPTAPTERLSRGLRIRRLRLLGPTRTFGVDFREKEDPQRLRALSVVAGGTNTGKTSVLRFIEYALGAKTYPPHSEVLRQVRSVALEIETPEGLFTLERALDTNRVLVYPSAEDALDAVGAIAHIVEPTSDPESISQFALETVGLQDVELKEAPTKDESGTDRMSFRDLMWVCLYLNDRVGSQQLLHAGNVMKSLKLRQVVDAIYGVHDNEQADLARRIRDAQAALDQQRRSLEHLTDFVTQQQPKQHEALVIEATDLDDERRQIERQLADLKGRERAASDFATEMRTYRASLAARATVSANRVRDRVSLLDRFGSLRAQYADDVRKLTMLVEAEDLFNELSVEVCPACFNRLEETPHRDDGTCGLCSQPIAVPTDDDPASDGDGNVRLEAARRELRAAKRRSKELDEYWQRLSEELEGLRQRADEHARQEAEANRRLDEATKDALSPFLAERDELQARRQANLVQRSQVTDGLKLHAGLESRQESFARAQRNLEALRKEQRENKQRPDRDSVVSQISRRYAEILTEIQYPKVDEDSNTPPYLDNNLVPYVRGQHFKEASSGGQVLVSLAWMLAIFEIAYETNNAHPGFLMIDTPQKNLGGKADDAEFADIHLVERVYQHIVNWLEGAGRDAQVIIVDNTPPDLFAGHVVVRYTRDPNRPPFGLIENEVGGVQGEAPAADETNSDNSSQSPPRADSP
jgi:hypothetical protein